MLKITCCEECRRKRRLCRCKPSIQSVVPHDANNGSREALRPQSEAVPTAAATIGRIAAITAHETLRDELKINAIHGVVIAYRAMNAGRPKE